MTVVRVTHIGGPTTLVEFDGWRILTDPTFDEAGRTYRFGWGTSSRKTTGPAIPADAIGPLDAVLLTHDHHADNLDDAGRRLLPGAGVVVTTTSGAARLGGGTVGLRAWEVTRLESPGKPTIGVTATPCRHGPPGSHPIVGDVVGFALTWAGQEHGALWFSGDTVLYRGVREVPARLDVGTAVVHLGRVRFGLTGPVTYTMDVDDAIELCEPASPHTILPVHYEGWSHFTEHRAEIEAQLARSSSALVDRVRWAPLGEPTELTV